MNIIGVLFRLALVVAWAADAAAQPTAVWSPTVGGDGFEELSDLVLAPGGGFLAVGKSTSPQSGNLTNRPQGSEDLLAVRVSPDGEILWQQRVGGDHRDGGAKVITDNLGRFVIAGYSYSTNSGNKTSIRQAAGEWASDLWMVCLDAGGNVVWDRSFGGRDSEEAVGLTLTPDGNYLVLGRTTSQADVATSRQTALKGSRSYWLLDVAPDGSLVSERTYGGGGDDLAWGMRRLRDDTYMLYGASQSGASLDKTTPSFGSSDMWLLHIRRDGSIVRDFQFGGDQLENPFVMAQYADGDIFLGGQSLSGVSGNKSVALIGDEVDFWGLRFELATGRIRWDRGYGGTGFDDIYSLGRNLDDHLLVAGTTRSSVRTHGSSTIGGRDDAWLMYLDPAGEPVWDITRGGEGNESVRSVIRSEAGGWYFGGISNSDPFDWKEGPARGTLFNGVRSNDIWLAKLGCSISVDLGEATLQLCEADTITLRNTAAPNAEGASYLWSDGSTAATLRVPTNTPATYQLTVVSQDACTASDTIQLSFAERPRLLNTSIEDLSCGEARSGSITVSVNAATQSYTLAGRTFRDAGTTVTDLTAGAYPLRLIGNPARCSLDTVLTIGEAAALILALPPRLEVKIGDQVEIGPGIDTAGVRFAWRGASVECSSCAVQRFEVTKDDLLELTATRFDGCSAKDSVRIVAVKDLSVGIPNIFSPNNDGNNDHFSLHPSPYVRSLGPLRIFDRWGNQVFVGTNAEVRDGEGWNGDFRGRPAAAGAYSFVCGVEYLDGSTTLLEGDFVLIR